MFYSYESCFLIFSKIYEKFLFYVLLFSDWFDPNLLDGD